MTKDIKYKNPPLVEVVCEFRFDLENPNDTIIPGLLYSKIADDFPTRKQKNLGAFVPLKGGNIEQELMLNPLAQFYNNAETKLVQVGLDILSINCIKKYPNWQNFKPLILDILSKYIDIANPKSIKRIRLRTINKILIDKTDLDLSNYFNKFYPSSPIEEEEPLSGFVLHIEKCYNEGRDIIVMKNGTIVAEKPDHIGFMLDFDYIMNKPNAINFNQVDKWLEVAYLKLNTAFESCITDKLREQFNK